MEKAKSSGIVGNSLRMEEEVKEENPNRGGRSNVGAQKRRHERITPKKGMKKAQEPLFSVRV